MIDVDFFKQYNDYYGHAMGDFALQKIAKALESILRRPADFLARYGGEEFVILLPETDASGAHTIADLALKQVAALDIPHLNSQAADHVTVSIGLATVLMDNEIAPKIFMGIADQNLYHAKQGGRNRVVGSVIE